MYFVSKGDLRKMVVEYRDRVRVLVHENYQLRRGFDEMHRRATVAEAHIANTENFLAVLQGEQINTTELN